MSLYSINRSAFITRTECVHCAVRNEFLKTIQVSFCLHVKSVVDKVSLEQSFLRILLLSTVSIIPPMLHTRICPHAAHREGMAKSGSNKTAMIYRQSAVVQQQTVKYVHLAIRMVNTFFPTGAAGKPFTTRHCQCKCSQEKLEIWL